MFVTPLVSSILPPRNLVMSPPLPLAEYVHGVGSVNASPTFEVVQDHPIVPEDKVTSCLDEMAIHASHRIGRA